MGLVPTDLSEHFTNPNPEVERLRRKTMPGMAHWAGSGPPGKTCRECISWTGCGKGQGYFSKTGMKGGGLKPRRCEKHRQMMRGALGAPVPHSCASCKYFNENPTPPSMAEK